MITKKAKLPIYQVDAFTDVPFAGNPAGVCLLSQPLDDSVMQNIAAEMNLSETAFVLPTEDRSVYGLRWFTPKIEIPLCGHATLGTAAVLFNEIGIEEELITFRTMNSGELIARRSEDGVELDFPLDESQSVDPPDKLLRAMGISDYVRVFYGRRTRKLVIHLPDEQYVRKLMPNFSAMEKFSWDRHINGVGVTARGKQYDFVSRYFHPWAGVNEDPVTGSVHTLLASYWAEILGQNKLRAYQASSRGGELVLSVRQDGRVDMYGKAVIVLRGEFYLS